MYVDYVKRDDKHYWITPNDLLKKDAIYGSLHHSFIFTLIKALHTIGCTSSEGLEMIASKWRPIEIKDNMPRCELEDINRDILKVLSKRGLLHSTKEEFDILTRYWLYPLYPLDLGVKKMDLKKMQSEAEG
ncbi:MAG: hypothetical protein D8M57_20210 [Candidatus Scalindua sp. AMX11]|nr:hypothetical protein [Planctomycetota bacterium]RZV60211.1 MAG: hypothetical protein EX341_19415 [Candidatus Scalindua sp. SCAELEC01]TDE63076.1 MAG: hypothetical protein D8M57_20210 [Candidatus Scalindua sp. AMX11]